MCYVPSVMLGAAIRKITIGSGWHRPLKPVSPSVPYVTDQKWRALNRSAGGGLGVRYGLRCRRQDLPDGSERRSHSLEKPRMIGLMHTHPLKDETCRFCPYTTINYTAYGPTTQEMKTLQHQEHWDLHCFLSPFAKWNKCFKGHNSMSPEAHIAKH